jgi:hypothetical protein
MAMIKMRQVIARDFNSLTSHAVWRASKACRAEHRYLIAVGLT